jgi:hypothetical protein
VASSSCSGKIGSGQFGPYAEVAHPCSRYGAQDCDYEGDNHELLRQDAGSKIGAEGDPHQHLELLRWQIIALQRLLATVQDDVDPAALRNCVWRPLTRT